jgi:uncharacterized membrane protein HdeD (DUF308 family)
MHPIFPGHAKAITWIIALIAAFVVFARTGNLVQVLGILVLIKGMFLADQATHLDQEAHSEPAPTSLERFLQHYKWTGIFVGLILIVLGLVFLVPVNNQI